MYQKSASGRRRAYHARVRRRRRRQRLATICCLLAFFLGFLSGKTVTLNIMKCGRGNTEVQADAGVHSDDSNTVWDGQVKAAGTKSGEWNMLLVNREEEGGTAEKTEPYAGEGPGRSGKDRGGSRDQ